MTESSKRGKDQDSYLDHMLGAGGGEATRSRDSLSSAFDAGFLVLKILMAVLAVVFFFSNIYWVPEGTVAIQSRFGGIVGEGAGAGRPPGGPYLAWPYPVDRIIRIPTTIQKVSVFRAFWSEGDSMEPVIDDRPETEGLRPGVHGSLVTADKNLVQGIWVVHYKLDYNAGDPEAGLTLRKFVSNVGSMERAGEIVRRISQNAIVRVVSQTTVSDFISGQIDNKEIGRLISSRLSRLSAGLKVTSVSVSKYAAPKSLVPAFQAVTEAESEKALSIEKATRRRVSTLNEIAGSGWKDLLEAIDAYEQALESGGRAEEQAAFKNAEEILLRDSMGGLISGILDEARSEKTSNIQRTRASSTRFEELLPSYMENPEVLRNQLIQDALEEIWSDLSVKTLYIPKGQRLFLDLSQSNPLLD